MGSVGLEPRSRWSQDFDFAVDALAELGFGDFEFIAHLQAQPDRRACAEVLLYAPLVFQLWMTFAGSASPKDLFHTEERF